MELLYPWIKVLHLAAVIAWFAALMYLPRLFINHLQQSPGSESAKLLEGMERRLAKGIMTPAMIAVWLFGIGLVAINPGFAASIWFPVKVVAVVAITGIHGFYTSSMKKFASGTYPKTDKFWRIMNEVPFLLLLVILVMVVLIPF